MGWTEQLTDINAFLLGAVVTPAMEARHTACADALGSCLVVRPREPLLLDVEEQSGRPSERFVLPVRS